MVSYETFGNAVNIIQQDFSVCGRQETTFGYIGEHSTLALLSRLGLHGSDQVLFAQLPGTTWTNLASP